VAVDGEALIVVSPRGQPGFDRRRAPGLGCGTGDRPGAAPSRRGPAATQGRLRGRMCPPGHRASQGRSARAVCDPRLAEGSLHRRDRRVDPLVR